MVNVEMGRPHGRRRGADGRPGRSGWVPGSGGMQDHQGLEQWVRLVSRAGLELVPETVRRTSGVVEGLESVSSHVPRQRGERPGASPVGVQRGY